ncbi:NF041680 family putative transposase [Dactylosporangium sp. McL0621]|uniref:NF041680 family putative transposase n=1 Tax=Dactylosporangium sp. McL0621 TaxID=3415678 RepID=UPI003CEFFBAD
MKIVHDADVAATSGELATLSRFRSELYGCLTARADALFELSDALLCTEAPVKALVDLTLAPEHRRGHGAMYDGLNEGRIDIERLRTTVAGLVLPRAADGRLMLAVDVSPWLRPDAATSPDRLFCHVYGRGRNADQYIPGWPYSFIAALEPGRTSWTAILDAVRLGPDDDVAEITAVQVRAVVQRLVEAGQWRTGDPDILIVFDAGYDLARLAFLLTDLPVEIVGRIRADRVMRLPAPPREPGLNGRPPKHGKEFRLAEQSTWPDPAVITTTDTTRYGTAVAISWDRLHPRLTHRAAWLDHQGDLPVLEGTLICLTVDRLPGDHDPKPVWLWSSRTAATPSHVDRLWQAYLRRFDLEHTFRLFKQTLGWTAPKLRDPRAADRWTWLIITCYTQLRLARTLAADLRRPWERPALPGRLTPARVRRGFRNIRPKTVRPANAPKPSTPGPGRPTGSKNTNTTIRHDVGKTTMRDKTLKERQQRTG